MFTSDWPQKKNKLKKAWFIFFVYHLNLNYLKMNRFNNWTFLDLDHLLLLLSVTEVSACLSCHNFNLCLNDVRTSLMHVWMCSLVSQEQYLVSIILIVEKAGSRLCVEPNIIKICRSTVFRDGKALRTVALWSQGISPYRLFLQG